MMNKFVKWVDQRFPLLSTWKGYATEYYLPKNLNFFYFFGSLAIVVLVIQLITGLWLAMFYIPTAEQAFGSIEFIMRDVNYGWLLRYMHSTGASAFFIVIYFHIFKALLYGSYQKPRELVWLLGVALYVLLTAEALFGYLLPWGQMSYWGMQVMTSLFSAIPFIGESIVTWLRGDYHVANASLQRVFALHVIALPFVLLVTVLLHLVGLHKVGSNNPEGIEIKEYLNEQGNPIDRIPFHPYFTIKEFVAILVFLIGFFAIVFFFPEMGGYFLEPENFTPANFLVTPEHIAPVWYLTPFYAILRAIPDKLMGVMLMGAALFILLFIPWLDKSPVRSMRYKGYYSKIALSAFVMSFVILGYLGTTEVTPVKLCCARICTAVYFAYFLLMPVYSRYEKHQRTPERING
jgi:ubiquinol-cytochrome c reductase cytochrome b subunit